MLLTCPPDLDPAEVRPVDPPDDTKACAKCGEVKELLAGFGVHRKERGGYFSVCKDCRGPANRASKKKYWAARPGGNRPYRQAFNKAHPGYYRIYDKGRVICPDCHRTYSTSETWTAGHPEGKCVDPAQAGLMERQSKAGPVWGFPPVRRRPLSALTTQSRPGRRLRFLPADPAEPPAAAPDLLLPVPSLEDLLAEAGPCPCDRSGRVSQAWARAGLSPQAWREQCAWCRLNRAEQDQPDEPFVRSAASRRVTCRACGLVYSGVRAWALSHPGGTCTEPKAAGLVSRYPGGALVWAPALQAPGQPPPALLGQPDPDGALSLLTAAPDATR